MSIFCYRTLRYNKILCNFQTCKTESGHTPKLSSASPFARVPQFHHRSTKTWNIILITVRISKSKKTFRSRFVWHLLWPIYSLISSIFLMFGNVTFFWQDGERNWSKPYTMVRTRHPLGEVLFRLKAPSRSRLKKTFKGTYRYHYKILLI